MDTFFGLIVLPLCHLEIFAWCVIAIAVFMVVQFVLYLMRG